MYLTRQMIIGDSQPQVAQENREKRKKNPKDGKKIEGGEQAQYFFPVLRLSAADREIRNCASPK
jgi:hypothetical protein